MTMREDTELQPLGGGVYETVLSSKWSNGEGSHQHGGFVMALGVAALEQEFADSEMGLHHLSVQYLRPVFEGPFRVELDVERQGRRMANVVVRLISGGKVAGLAIGSVARELPGPEMRFSEPPLVAPFDPDEEPMVWRNRGPVRTRCDRYARVDERRRGDGEVRGGWVVPSDAEVIDHRWLCYTSDIWLPASFGHWEGDHPPFRSVDITYHARHLLPSPEIAPGSPVLVMLRTVATSGPFIDEDCEMWSADGTFLGQSRQIRILLTDG